MSKPILLWQDKSTRLVEVGGNVSVERARLDLLTGHPVWTTVGSERAVFEVIGSVLLDMAPQIIWTDGDLRMTNRSIQVRCFPIERKGVDLLGNETWIEVQEQDTEERIRTLVIEHGARILRERL